MNKHLIILQGQGDFYAFFIDPDLYKWATNYDVAPPQSVIDAYTKNEREIAQKYGSQREPTPQEILEELKGTNGSWDNDRMLMMMNLPDVDLHCSSTDAHKAATSQGWTILGEYHGYVY